MSFYTIKDKLVTNYKSEVELKYEMLNGLFLGLPLDKEYNSNSKLAIFSNNCKIGLNKGKSIIDIVNGFETDTPEKQKLEIFIKFIRYIERQVVLIDAIEEAAYTKTHDLNGDSSIARLVRKAEQSDKLNELDKALDEYKTRLVLTAHPTQFYANLVLPIINELKDAISKNNIEKIREIFLQMEKTKFSNNTKPTPEDEAISIIWYLKNIFYDVITNVQHKLTDNNQNIELGFWPGGDRDGNPFVIANVTKKVAKHLRQSIFECYIKDLNKLIQKLTFDGIYDELIDTRKKLKANKFKTSLQLLENLYNIRTRIKTCYDSLFIEKLDSFILRVKIFGFYFAKLDIRQNAKVHQQVFTEIFKENLNIDYISLSRSERITLLEKIAAEKKLSQIKINSEQAKELFATINVIHSIQQKNGFCAIERYIISNADSTESILEILTLITMFNNDITDESKKIRIEVVPLFETMEDLENSTEIIDTLLKTSLYNKNLALWKNAQTIMLGFSDGTKDGGYFMANWSILEAKRNLSKYFKNKGIKPIFFDGRGGPPSRGGGDMFLFYKGLANVVSNHDVQITIQGQSISSKFGDNASAQYNLEQILTSGLHSKLNLHNSIKLTPSENNLINKLATLSFKAYSDLKNHPKFMDYLVDVTPLKYISEMNIGSRPSKRNTDSRITLNDLRAIPYGAAWMQMRQSILAFYGLGSAIDTLIKEDGNNLDTLKAIYNRSLIIKGVIDNALQSIGQTDFELTKHLLHDQKYSEFWQNMYNEYLLSKKYLLSIANKSKDFLHFNPIKERSIRMRDSITLPLTVLQQYALDCLRKNPQHKHAELLKTIIKKSLAANINANQNSI